MEYEWESQVTETVLAELDNLLFTKTGLTLAGVSVANHETGEAAE